MSYLYRRMPLARIFPLLLVICFILSAVRGHAQTVPNINTEDPEDQGVFLSALYSYYPDFSQAVKKFDAYPTWVLGSCFSLTSVYDRVSQTCISPPGLTYSTASGTFTSTRTASASSSITPIYTAPAGAYTTGPDNAFMVAASLNPAVAITGIQTIFVLYPNAPAATDDGTKLAFALLRDGQGHIYAGKSIDGPADAAGRPTQGAYMNRIWDPVSPCLTAGFCTSDTYYVSFLQNGQIEIDEIALLATAPASGASPWVWNSVTLNYGYPVTGYQSASTTSGKVGPPSGTPSFFALDQLAIGSLPASQFGTNTTYLQYNTPGANYAAASLKRIAFWSLFTSTGTPSLSTLQNFQSALLEEAQAFQSSNAIDTRWRPCNSGQFQNGFGNYNPGITPNGGAPYSTQSTLTPCNSNVSSGFVSVLPAAITFPSRDTYHTNTQNLTVLNAYGASGNVTFQSSVPYQAALNKPDYSSFFTVSPAASGGCTAGLVLAPGASCIVQVAFSSQGNTGSFGNTNLAITTSAGGVAPVPLSGLTLANPSVSASLSSTNPNSAFTVNWVDQNPTSITATYTPVYTVNVDGTAYSQCVNLVGYSNTSCSVTNQSSGRLHTVSVTETISDISVTGSSSIPTTLVPPSIVAPSTSQVTTNSINFTWTDPNNLGTATPVYTVQHSPSSGTCSVSGTTATCTGLAALTSYTFTVSESIGSISSAASAPLVEVTVPQAPNGLSAVSVNGSSFNLSWNDSNNLGSLTATYYVLVDGASKCMVTSPTHSCSASNVLTGTQHSVQVAELIPNSFLSYSTALPVTLSPAKPYGFTQTSKSMYTINLSFTDTNVYSGPATYTYTYQKCFVIEGYPYCNYYNAGTSSTTTNVHLRELPSCSVLPFTVTVSAPGVSVPSFTGTATTNCWWNTATTTATGMTDGLRVLISDPNTYDDNTPVYNVQATPIVNGVPTGNPVTFSSSSTTVNLTGLDADTSYQITTDVSDEGETSETESITSPDTLAAVNLNLSSVANVYAVVTPGTSVAANGLDNGGNSYPSTQIPTSVLVSGSPIYLGSPNVADAVSSATIPLPYGSYTTLTLVGTGTNGAQTNQTFTVTYTDGTSTSFTQSLSDWWLGSAQLQSGKIWFSRPV